MTDGRVATTLPPLVVRALALAEEMEFDHSCSAGTGRLLQLLVSQYRSGTIGEIGTGCGVGAAWVASALAPDTSFVTVELDEERAAAAGQLLAPCRNVRVLTGDWDQLLAYGPFTLLFADGGKAKVREPERLLEALAPGGMLLLDDLTPIDQWPPEWRGQPDPVRDFWLNDPRLIAMELLVTPTEAVILATRRG